MSTVPRRFCRADEGKARNPPFFGERQSTVDYALRANPPYKGLGAREDEDGQDQQADAGAHA